MAGIEKSGYDASFDGMFDKASMILCKLNTRGGDADGGAESESTADYNRRYDEAYEGTKAFFTGLGFGFIKETTPKEHDRVIAYTSQMAHVVSNAYIKSPSAGEHKGFSADSYEDLTRVAGLNPTMWAELFLENRDCLLFELDTLIGNLNTYKEALERGDREELVRLLDEGRRRKEEVDGR